MRVIQFTHQGKTYQYDTRSMAIREVGGYWRFTGNCDSQLVKAAMNAQKLKEVLL